MPFCLAVSAAAALASAIACWAAWKLFRKFYTKKCTRQLAKCNYRMIGWLMFATYQHRIDKPIQKHDFHTTHRHINGHIVGVIHGCFFQIVQNNLAGESVTADDRQNLRMNYTISIYCWPINNRLSSECSPSNEWFVCSNLPQWYPAIWPIPRCMRSSSPRQRSNSQSDK